MEVNGFTFIRKRKAPDAGHPDSQRHETGPSPKRQYQASAHAPGTSTPYDGPEPVEASKPACSQVAAEAGAGGSDLQVLLVPQAPGISPAKEGEACEGRSSPHQPSHLPSQPELVQQKGGGHGASARSQQCIRMRMNPALWS